MAIQRIDLNLLRVFEAVLRTGSVSGAGKELGVTASAVSHALGRLRTALGDELFVYGENGMAPTARALEIAPAVRGGLGLIDEAMDARPFVPAETVRTFRISATDYGAMVVLTPLIARLARLAPLAELCVFPSSRPDVVRHLDEGRIDLVVGWFGDLPERVTRTYLLRDRESIVVRAGHPLAEGPVTRERLFSFPFAVVELTGSGEQGTDGFVDERGVWRRTWIDRLLMETDADGVAHVALSVPHYAAVPGILAVTDFVATLPERVARPLAQAGTHVMLDLPYPPFEATVEALAHERSTRDPAIGWLLREMAQAVNEAQGPD